MRALPTALLLLLVLSTGCGEEAAPTAAPVPAPAPAPATGAADATAPKRAPPAGPRTLAGVAQAVDVKLAGLRGEAAAGYARSLLDAALPAGPGAARDAVLDALKTGSPTERWVALLALPRLAGIDDALLMALLPQTQAAESYLHAAAFEALRAAQTIDDKAAERMWRVQAQAGPSLRAALLHALGAARGSDGRDDVLLTALRAEEPALVRRAAAFALFRSLHQAPSVAGRPPDLVTRLGAAAGADEDHGVRTYAVHALAQLGVAGLSQAAVLVRCLADPSPRVRTGATTALVAVGEGAVPELVDALGGPDHRRIEASVYILRRIGTDSAVAALRTALTEGAPFVRGRSAMALQGMQVEGIDALAVYRSLLKEEDARVVLLGLEGLGMLGRDAAPAIDDVRPLLQHTDTGVRSAARVWLDLVDRR